MNPLCLLFVYNANSGLFSSLTDFAHKIISPKTYNCSLCALTYGHLTMKQEWKSFIGKLPAEKTFLHKDEFEKQYGKSFELPAVFRVEDNQPVTLISADELNHFHSLQELMAVLSQRIQMLQNTLV